MDTVDAVTRSRIMASVHGKDTTPEMVVRKSLHRLGFRYRLHCKDLPGSPDLVFPRYRAVIFIHGCFWHRHGCRMTTTPSTRRAFWEEKFRANEERDRRGIALLHEQGWRILVIWECWLKRGSKYNHTTLMNMVSQWIQGSISDDEICIQDVYTHAH